MRGIVVRRRMRSGTICLAFACLAAPWSSALGAQELQPVTIHGFGHWSYGRTRGNDYLGATPEGEFRNSYFALNLGTNIQPSVGIHAQLFWNRTAEGSEAEIDYAFAAWQWDPDFGLRAGRIPHPFGIYNEVYDVGTIRPFLSLPQSVYGAVGLVSEGLDGVSARGRIDLGGSWALSYDAYVGGLDVFVAGADDEEGGEPETGKEVIGGRLVAATPLPGLVFGASGYTGIHSEPTAEASSERDAVLGAHLSYVGERVWVRSEAFRSWATEGLSAWESYVEAAVFLTRRLQASGTLGRVRSTANGDSTESPDEHTEDAFGLAFWVSPEMVLKGSLGRVRGNLLVASGSGEPEGGSTRVLNLGVQFSF